MDHTMVLIDQAQKGDPKAKEQLVVENKGLVWCVAKRFFHRGTEPEDLFQIGNVGLLKAIDKFDPSYQVKFSTYAVPMIAGEIKRFLRDDGMIKVSRSLRELACKAAIAQERFRREYNREPLLSELAHILQVETEALVEAMEAATEVESLQKVIYQKDGHEISLLEKLEDPQRMEEKTQDHLMLNQLLGYLSSEERKFLYFRYYANLTQAEIGELFGISQVQVSRTQKRILEKMRKELKQS